MRVVCEPVFAAVTGCPVRRSNKFANPFYGLLLVAGIAFAVTSALYCVMVVRETRTITADTPEAAPEKHPLVAWMSHYGDAALIVELVLLGMFTAAAIGSDEYWQRRAATQQDDRNHI